MAEQQAESKELEADRLAKGLRKWARYSANVEMQRILLASADWIEEHAKQGRH